MVREVRVAWNDPAEQQRFRALPLEDDDAEDGEDSPLEPPPQRRCSRRGRRPGSDHHPAGTTAPLSNPPDTGD